MKKKIKNQINQIIPKSVLRLDAEIRRKARKERKKHECLNSQTNRDPSFLCTRRKGHKGDHIARGDMDAVLARWPQGTGYKNRP